MDCVTKPAPSPAAASPERGAFLARYRQLLGNLDAFQREVRSMYAAQITCGDGCFSCCRTRLAVFPIEADSILDGMDDGRDLAPLRERLENDTGPLAEYCPFLVAGGCAVYEHRPLLCRIHGLPNSSKSYPAGAIEFCEQNFHDLEADAIAPAAVLDWDHAGNALALLNFRYSENLGRDELGRLRVPLVEVARNLCGLPVERPAATPAVEPGTTP